MPRLPIRWGLSLPNRGVLFGLTDLNSLKQAAILAERSGVFDSVWFGDSLLHKPRVESIVMLSAAAAWTERVRLGVICMASFPVRHPVLLAIQWASLDQLSNGRALLGVCIGGGHDPELRAFGARRSERVGRLVEGIAMLRGIWSSEEFGFQGKYYKLEPQNIVPKPVQQPCPIWIAVSPDRAAVGDAVVDNAMRRVARLADGYITMGVTAAEFRRRWEIIAEAANASGRNLAHFETSIHGMVNINDDRKAAYDEAKYYFGHYYAPGYPPDELIKVWLAHGSPAQCAEMLQSWIDMGITTPVLRFAAKDQLGQVGRFVEEVLPLLRLN
jgi:alkanesulfonate monooxygenase SsuD/methylene tetrahydromethanopterin reductase-like flavin-dependent oxidoreductase (luciferase family)